MKYSYIAESFDDDGWNEINASDDLEALRTDVYASILDKTNREHRIIKVIDRYFPEANAHGIPDTPWNEEDPVSHFGEGE